MPLAFAQPWMLLALALLPGLWWLTRARPPAPVRVFFPPVRLLLGLENAPRASHKTDTLRLMLRAALCALLIVGLAGPHFAAPPDAAQTATTDDLPRVAIVETGARAGAPPLLDPLHYLRAALAGQAQIVQHDADLTIALAPVEAQQNWVLAFAEGGALALDSAALGPGAAQGITDFAGPLAELEGPQDVRVRRYAAPGAGDVWARLESGAPLITAKGRHVRVGTGLSPWASDLALSPLLPEIVGRIAHAAAQDRWARSAPAAQQEPAQPLGPYLIFAALLLFLLDWAWRPRRTLAALLVLAACPALADPPLAYISTGDDAAAQAGLSALAEVLNARTTAAPQGAGPLAGDPAAHSFVYWAGGPLTPDAQKSVQHYLDHGGVLLMDAPTPGAGGGLALPPLEPAGDGHILARVFYAIPDFAALGVWAEAGGADAPARLIVSTRPLAPAWAAGDEAALRLGVNIALYAATGTYKDDPL